MYDRYVNPKYQHHNTTPSVMTNINQLYKYLQGRNVWKEMCWYLDLSIARLVKRDGTFCDIFCSCPACLCISCPRCVIKYFKSMLIVFYRIWSVYQKYLLGQCMCVCVWFSHTHYDDVQNTGWYAVRGGKSDIMKYVVIVW